MKKQLETIEEDGKMYWIEEVKKDGKSVGQAGTEIPKDENLEGALELYGSKQIYDLAMAQLRTNNRNTIRSGGSTLKASDVVNAIIRGKLVATEVEQNAKLWFCNFTKAGARMLAPGINSNKIIFFATKKIDEEIED